MNKIDHNDSLGRKGDVIPEYSIYLNEVFKRRGEGGRKVEWLDHANSRENAEPSRNDRVTNA